MWSLLLLVFVLIVKCKRSVANEDVKPSKIILKPKNVTKSAKIPNVATAPLWAPSQSPERMHVATSFHFFLIAEDLPKANKKDPKRFQYVRARATRACA